MHTLFSVALCALAATGSVAKGCNPKHTVINTITVTAPHGIPVQPSMIASTSVAPAEDSGVDAEATSVETSPFESSSIVVPALDSTTSALPTSEAAPSDVPAVSEVAQPSVGSNPRPSTFATVVATSSAAAAPEKPASTIQDRVRPSSTKVAKEAAPTSPNPAAVNVNPTKKFCGKPNESEVLFGTPWIVFSMNYNYQDIQGTCCTGYFDYTGEGKDQTIHWSVHWDIDQNFKPNSVKGYNFIGLTQGLETRLDEISSIPSKYTWTASNATTYKGNVVYDFMTCDTKGDSTSSKAQELMLWLRWEGGQVPIGWVEGPIATINGLYGKNGWKLYQGVNTDTGITVTSLLAPEDDQFGDLSGGDFEGDIKDWLVELADQKVFAHNTYVNVGNAGMEPYWGTVNFDNHLSLRIEL